MLALGDEALEEPECGILHCSSYPVVEADGGDSNAGWGASGGTVFLVAETTATRGGDSGTASSLTTGKAGSVVGAGDGDVEGHP
jgi:hypothetical protein